MSGDIFAAPFVTFGARKPNPDRALDEASKRAQLSMHDADVHVGIQIVQAAGLATALRCCGLRSKDAVTVLECHLGVIVGS